MLPNELLAEIKRLAEYLSVGAAPISGQIAVVVPGVGHAIDAQQTVGVITGVSRSGIPVSNGESIVHLIIRIVEGAPILNSWLRAIASNPPRAKIGAAARANLDYFTS